MNDSLSLDHQLCFALYEASSQFTKLYSTALRSFEITYPQYLVLLALWEQNGVTLKELGEKLNLGTGTLTPMIKRMEANGWIQKERSSIDERQVHIHLTKKSNHNKPSITAAIAKEIKSCNISLEDYNQLMKQLKSLQMKLKHR